MHTTRSRQGKTSNEKTLYTKMIFVNLVPTFSGCAAAPHVTKELGSLSVLKSGRADKVEALKIKAPITTERPPGFK